MIHSALHRLHNPHLGLLFVRLAIGIVFIMHGWQKVTNVDATLGFMTSIGIPAFLAYIAIYVEFFGGILMVVGFLTRYAAILLAVMMAVATFYVHWSNGYSLAAGGYEYALALLLGSLALIFMGAGKYSLAGLLRNRMCHDCEVGAPKA